MITSYPLLVALAMLLFANVIAAFILWQEKERILRLLGTGLMLMVLLVIGMAILQAHLGGWLWSW